MSDTILVFGAGGHAKVVVDAALRGGLKVAALFDDDPGLSGQQLLGCPVLGGRPALEAWARQTGTATCLVAIGDNLRRLSIVGWLREAGFGFATLVHPVATVGRGVELGAGTVLFAGAIVNADAEIGQHVIVNTAASVDHDCHVADGVHIGPGARLCGGASVGERALLGAGCIVLPGVRIGSDAVLGAGSTALRDVPDGARAVGTPAKLLGALR